jgi:hypothetical protein
MNEATALFTLYAFMMWAGTALASRIEKRRERKIKLYGKTEESEKLCYAIKKRYLKQDLLHVWWNREYVQSLSETVYQK